MNFFKQLFRRILGIDIIKVFSLNAISTMVRMLAGLISVKIVASIIGPAGIALLGQLHNVVTMLLGVANGGIQNGVTKYISEYKDDEVAIKGWLSNAFRITLFFSVIVGLGLILFHTKLSELILLSNEYGYVFCVFGFTIILYTLNMLLISILNGHKEFKRYVKVNICGTLFGLVFSITLVTSFGLTGAMINAVTFQSVMFFVTLLMCRECKWLKWENFKGNFDRVIASKYMSYSLMTLTTLSIVPVSQMLLRGYVISEISITEAGWWEGMNRISAMYLNIITTSFSVYYLPRLSEITDSKELRKEILRCYKIILPILIMAMLAIYLLRHFIIWLLFTPDFYPMEEFFIWQMLGDFFKVSSWLLAFLMVAKAMTKTFILTEIFSGLSFVALGYVCMRLFGTIGLTKAYFINYVVYMLCMLFLFRKLIFIKK